MKGEKLLRTTLFVNAGFSFLSGIDFIFFDTQISGFVLSNPSIGVLSVGVSLLFFATFVFWVASAKTLKKNLVIAIILMDISWVISSLALVGLTGSITFYGKFVVIGIAAVIFAFAFFQAKGLRETYS